MIENKTEYWLRNSFKVNRWTSGMVAWVSQTQKQVEIHQNSLVSTKKEEAKQND